MKVSQKATKGHLIVESILVAISLVCFIANISIQRNVLSFLIFFFGVWGGVELGRYIEYTLTNSDE